MVFSKIFDPKIELYKGTINSVKNSCYATFKNTLSYEINRISFFIPVGFTAIVSIKCLNEFDQSVFYFESEDKDQVKTLELRMLSKISVIERIKFHFAQPDQTQIEFNCRVEFGERISKDRIQRILGLFDPRTSIERSFYYKE